MWNGIPQQMPPQQQYQPGGMAPPIPGAQNRPRLEPIDWNLVAVLNADIIRRTQDYDSLQKLVQIFMAAKLYPGSSRILVHPLCLRLCQLLQVAFEYLSFCQKELSTTNTKLEAENAKLIEKSKKLTSKLKKFDQIIKTKNQPYDKCPICEKKFKSLEFVDQHIANRHSELAEAWSIVRGQKPPTNKENEDNVQIILDKIDHLKNSLKRGYNKNSNKNIEQELLATQQELMTAEELREQQEMMQNEEIRRQLFEAADDLNSSMTLYKDKTQKKKVLKKTKQQMAIVNLFDPNASVNPNDYQNYPNSESSPFNNNNNQENEIAKQKRIDNFFNQPPNPFQKQQTRPSNDIGEGPNWGNNINKNKVVNPFQNKTNMAQLSIPPENNIINNNNENNFKYEDEFGIDDFNNNMNLGNNEPIMNTGFKNNFTIENVNQENFQVVPQSNSNNNGDDKINDQLIKPIPKQAILAAKNFISKKNNEKKNRNQDSRNVKATPENIEKVISMIGDKVQAEVQRLGPNGVAPLMLRQKYGDNDPNYMILRKQIQQKLEMEYPMDGSVTKVKKGFDLVHTEDLASINTNNNNINNNYEFGDNENDQFYDPADEQPIMKNDNLNDFVDSQFTSAFEFNNNNNIQSQQLSTEKEKDQNEEEIPDKISNESADVISTNKNSESIQIENSSSKVKNESSKNKKPDDDEWSYINSSTSEKVATNQEKKETVINGQNSPSIIKDSSKHSISFDSSSTSSKLKSKAKKQNNKNDKSEFDFIQSDMKPNLSDSPSRKTETQSPLPIKDQKQNSSKEEEGEAVDQNISVHTPERKDKKNPGTFSLEIFNSPVISHGSNSRLSSKSKMSSSSKIVDLDEDSTENLPNADKLQHKSKDLSESSETELKQNIDITSKIEPLSEDEFNFPPVTTDSFLNSSNDELENDEVITKDDLNKKNQLSNRKENQKKINQSNFNSNLANGESESYKSNATSISKQSESGSKSRMSVLSSAIRIGRADDTKTVFQNNADETNSSVIEGKEPVISRRKPKNSPIRKEYKDPPQTKSNINIALDDIDPIEEEKQKKQKFEEYRKIADEKFRKEFDFDFDVTPNDNNNDDELQINNKNIKDDDEFELTGTSTEKQKNEEEEFDDSDDESGFMKPPPRFDFHLKAVDDDNDLPAKNTVIDEKPSSKRLIDIKNISNNINTETNDLHPESRNRILKNIGMNMISKTGTKHDQLRNDDDSIASISDDDQLFINLDKNIKKQFNEETDKKNQLLSHSFLQNSRNLMQENNNYRNDADYSDSENKYGYISDDEEEIKGLPRPDYFDEVNNNDDNSQNKSSKPNKKQLNDNSLFSSPLPPDPSVSSDSIYQAENERFTFYEEKKPGKSRASIKRKQKDEKKKDVRDISLLLLKSKNNDNNGNLSDDF